MSHNKSTADDELLMGRNHWDVPLRVELRRFLRFSRRMDVQLRRLVIRWGHAATPESRGLTIKPPENPNKKHRATG
jgi:hypothetical protein